MDLLQIIKNLNISNGVLAVIFIGLFNVSCNAQKEATSSNEVKDLHFEKIDPTDIKTYAFLKNILARKKIVLLGEKNHNDGSTIDLKLSLIKYLHDSLGYNILLIENGIYDTHRAMKDLAEHKDSAVGVFAYLFYLFPHIITEESIRFARYLDSAKDTKSPLLLNGVDITGGTIYHHALYLELEQLLHKLVSKKDSSVLVDYAKFSLKGRRKIFASSQESLKWMQNLNLDTISFYGNKVIRFLEQKQSELIHDSSLSQREIPLFVQTIHSIIANYPYTIDVTANLLKGKYGQGKDRDEFIAKNAIWYIDEYFPGQKFIISMSTFHTSKNISELREKYEDFKDIKPVGEYLFERYGQDVYSICFVNYSGTRRDLKNFNLTKIPVAPKGSIEKTLHELKLDFAFVNISDMKVFPDKFRNLSLSPIFDKWYSTDWSKVYDGIFFIDEMMPANIKLIKQRIGMKQPYILPKEYYENQ